MYGDYTIRIKPSISPGPSVLPHSEFKLKVEPDFRTTFIPTILDHYVVVGSPTTITIDIPHFQYSTDDGFETKTYFGEIESTGAYPRFVTETQDFPIVLEIKDTDSRDIGKYDMKVTCTLEPSKYVLGETKF